MRIFLPNYQGGYETKDSARCTTGRFGKEIRRLCIFSIDSENIENITVADTIAQELCTQTKDTIGYAF